MSAEAREQSAHCASFYDKESSTPCTLVRSMQALSRSYTQAVAGKNVKINFDPSSCQFLLHYAHTKIVSAPTEVCPYMVPACNSLGYKLLSP